MNISNTVLQTVCTVVITSIMKYIYSLLKRGLKGKGEKIDKYVKSLL